MNGDCSECSRLRRGNCESLEPIPKPLSAVATCIRDEETLGTVFHEEDIPEEMLDTVEEYREILYETIDARGNRGIVEHYLVENHVPEALVH